MIYIDNNCIDPYFNLASEEYLIKNFDSNCFMLWRNKPCIVVGRNQNTLSQINIKYVREHDIPVIRRLSGGGTVFHDLGNLNFTFISNSCDDLSDNFKKFTLPIIDVLKKLHINAKFSGRNDITIDNMKISGNAQYYYKDKLLHHGTLLFSANTSDIAKALKVNPLKFKDKGIKSISSRVTNIASHLKNPLSITQFKQLIMNHVMQLWGKDALYTFKKSDIEKINKLAHNKYKSWEWNFGSSPKYTFKNVKRYSGGSVEVNINVEGGIIKDIKFYGDFFGKSSILDVENALTGIRHDKSAVYNALTLFNIGNYFFNISMEELLEVILG